MMYKNVNGKEVELTESEIAEYNLLQDEYKNNRTAKKLKAIREIRNLKLKETDYLAMSDNTMPDNIKTWRQSLRDLPQNNTTEEQYDALLATDSDGNLTNSIWSKP